MDFTIIICTYNPEQRMLQQVIDACAVLRPGTEILVVDNNSDRPVKDEQYICDAMVKMSALRVINEPRQGQAFARLAGAIESRGEWLVFMDDDNVPDPSYLDKLERLIERHSGVGVWGAGVIEPFYIDGAPSWIRQHMGYLYQERHFTEVKYGAERGWPSYYPVGSGLCISRAAIMPYMSGVQNGSLSATGRTKGSLLCADDAQMVWCAVKAGYTAGTSPDLKLRHIIPAKRTMRKYLVKLNHSISESYHFALPEVFPGHRFPYARRSFISKALFAFRTLVKARFRPLLFYRLFTVENAWPRAFDRMS